MTLAIEYRKLADLTAYERNARTHDAANIKAIEASLAKFGWATPVGVADGVLVYGHARRIAAMNLRERGIVIPFNEDPNCCPVVDLSHLDADARRAYVLADNQTATLAGWDDTILRLELRELAANAFDLTTIGFSKADLADLLIEPVGDDIPGSLLSLLTVTIAEPAHTVEAGDHWVLAGRHHLLCVSVFEDWPAWKPLLKKGYLFVPYPGPFVPFGRKAQEVGLVMIQPDAYVAGHLLDRFAEVRGESALAKISDKAAAA